MDTQFFENQDRPVAGPPREIVGYGMNPPQFEWPDGKRVAVQIVVNYEEGSEKSFPMGDGRNDGYHELPYELEGKRDMSVESVYEYGSRAGIWRLFRIFKGHDVPVTIFGTAVALERNPQVAEHIRSAGYEVTFARYAVAPLMFAWLLYLVIKAFTTEGSNVLLAHPHATAPMGFPAAITVVIGFIMWGEEPDFFRFARPNIGAITRIYSFSLIFGFVLSGVGGWVMGQLAGTSDYGPAVKTITDYSLFGATWLAFILVLVGQIAINDGNYYVVTNAAQNVLAAIPWWKRQYTCVIAAALGGLAAWVIPYEITGGFEKVAAVGAIGVPTATLIMVADHFVVPRMFRISRPLDRVPAWRQAGRCNSLAVVALLIATGLGGWASDLLPIAPPNVNFGVTPLETWVLGVVLYLAGVALIDRVATPATIRALLGFSDVALESGKRYPDGTVIDVVSLAGNQAESARSYDPT